jgi:hypothetical protein
MADHPFGDALMPAARLCSQPLDQLFVDGEAKPSREVRLRASIDGSSAWSDVTGWMGVEERRFVGIPSPDAIRLDFLTWVGEVAERNRELREHDPPS